MVKGKGILYQFEINSKWNKIILSFYVSLWNIELQMFVSRFFLDQCFIIKTQEAFLVSRTVKARDKFENLSIQTLFINATTNLLISHGQIYGNITGTVESVRKEWDAWDNEQQ